MDLNGTTHTNARSYADTWTFTDTSGNYNNSSGTVNDIIHSYAPTTTIGLSGTPGNYGWYIGSSVGVTLTAVASWPPAEDDAMPKSFPRQLLYRLRNKIPLERLIAHHLEWPSKHRKGRFCFVCPQCSESLTTVNPRTNLARCFRCEVNFNKQTKALLWYERLCDRIQVCGRTLRSAILGGLTSVAGTGQATGAVPPETGERGGVAEVIRDEGQHGLDAV